MIDDLFQNEADENTIFRDVIFLALIAFVAMLIIVIPFLADPKEKEELETLAPGNLMAEIVWDNNLNDDIDLWVFGPGEVGPVGYSNKSGLVWNLLRDDIGSGNDLTNLNYENSYSRGLAEGWYRFNVHWYNSPSGVVEIKVNMVISIKKPNEATKQLMAREVILTRTGKEVTVFNFYLNKEFNVEETTIDFDFECLKCGGPTDGP